jgi:fumarate reductase subunit C
VSGHRLDFFLYLAQRVSAAILAPLVVVHLGLVVYATRGGLSAAEVLGRTQGSVFWALLYGLFVLAVAIHAPIGLRTIIGEVTRWRGRSLDLAMALIALALLALGFRAVAAVT